MSVQKGGTFDICKFLFLQYIYLCVAYININYICNTQIIFFGIYILKMI